MTEGEWMDDRWSMMLSLRKTYQKKREEKRECFFLSLPLTERERKAKVILFSFSFSLSLYSKQINLISLSRSFSFFLSVSLFFVSPLTESILRTNKEKLPRREPKKHRRAEKNFRFRYSTLLVVISHSRMKWWSFSEGEPIWSLEHFLLSIHSSVVHA